MKKTSAAAATAPFPGVYRGIPTETLLSVFEAAPERLALAIDGLRPEELSALVIPGKWTILQIVCHVADSETCGALRLRLVVAQPGSALPAYDQDRFAEGLGYEEVDDAHLRDTLDLFRSLRAVSARMLRRLPEEAWSRTGRHHQWGEVTLRQLLEVYADHGERHLDQILARRRVLGWPLDLDLRLPERLY